MAGNSYIPGQPYGICDRCGFQKRLKTELRKEWTGLMVCDPCYDVRPPEMSPPIVHAEGVPLPNARPDNQNADYVEITGDDL
jgi:hypothetical protein